MPTNCSYNHFHYMLIDTDHDLFIEAEGHDKVFSPVAFHTFLNKLAEIAGQQLMQIDTSETKHILFKSELAEYGIACGGPMPALYADPIGKGNCFDLHDTADPEICANFNKFIQAFNEVFRSPVSAWVSKPYTSYEYAS
ncbi:hypothetical protein LAV82_23365 [Bacillus sp. ILBB4]|nr:hypothetical protein [Bacillus sp. ILBB4]